MRRETKNQNKDLFPLKVYTFTLYIDIRKKESAMHRNHLKQKLYSLDSLKLSLIFVSLEVDLSGVWLQHF